MADFEMVIEEEQGSRQEGTPSHSDSPSNDLAVAEQMQRWAGRVDEFRSLRVRVADLEVSVAILKCKLLSVVVAKRLLASHVQLLQCLSHRELSQTTN